jgi:hypothetical protein
MNPYLLKLALDVVHGEPIHWDEASRMDVVSYWDVWIKDSLAQVRGSSVQAHPAALASLQELVLAAIEATDAVEAA